MGVQDSVFISLHEPDTSDHSGGGEGYKGDLRSDSLELSIKVYTSLSVEILTTSTGDGSLVSSEGEHGKGDW